jgi:hypothetical protein
VSDRDRTIAAAVTSLLGASMVVGGLLSASHRGALQVIGLVLLAFGGLAVLQAVALGLGVLPRHSRERRKERR